MGSVTFNLQAPPAPIFDMARPVVRLDRVTQLRRASEDHCTLAKLVQRYVSVSTGYGRISFDNFMRLRLFEPRFGDRERLRAFVGEWRNLDLCAKVNYRGDWFGMLADKVAEQSYLSAFGLPTIPFQAIYSPGCSRGAQNLGDAAELKHFLLHDARYPLFGKPVEGFQSLGSLGLRSCDSAMRTVDGFDGRRIAVDDLVGAIVGNYPDGYVFQSFVAPAGAIRALCGDRLSTVRFLTLQTADGPVIARAVMKIPGGANVADNFWRAGNLLAQIDPETGRLGRAISGSGLEMVELVRHPQTDAPLDCWTHPDWAAMRSLTLDGATTMRHVPMIGWDIAYTASGPTIVEMNATPDMFMFQLVDGLGMLDERFRDFVAFQTRRSQIFRKAAKVAMRSII